MIADRVINDARALAAVVRREEYASQEQTDALNKLFDLAELAVGPGRFTQLCRFVMKATVEEQAEAAVAAIEAVRS